MLKEKEELTLKDFKKRLHKKYAQDAERGKDPKPFIVKTNKELELEEIIKKRQND